MVFFEIKRLKTGHSLLPWQPILEGDAGLKIMIKRRKVAFFLRFQTEKAFLT